MSPCAKCGLREKSKDNDACRDCSARVRYALTGESGLEPPEVDVARVIFAFAENGAASPKCGGRGRKRRPPEDFGLCEFPGCSRPRESAEIKYCDVCYKRTWRRKRLGIPEFATAQEARRIGMKRYRGGGK